MVYKLKTASKNSLIKKACLTALIGLGSTSTFAQSYPSSVQPFNFTYSNPSGFQNYANQGGYTYINPTYTNPAYTYSTPVNVGSQTPTNVGVVAERINFRPPRFRPYGYVRASGEYLFNKVQKTDAAGQQIQFEDETKALGLRAGFMFSRYVGFEGRGAYGFDTETQTVGTAVSAHKVKGYVAAMARLQADFGSQIVPYANLGIGAVRTEFGSISGGTVINTNTTKMGLAAALGAELKVSQGLVLGLEASYLPTKIKTVGITAGFNF